MIKELKLADYIQHTMAQLDSGKNLYLPNESNSHYLVYPERRNEDSDEKINPFSEV